MTTLANISLFRDGAHYWSSRTITLGPERSVDATQALALDMLQSGSVPSDILPREVCLTVSWDGETRRLHRFRQIGSHLTATLTSAYAGREAERWRWTIVGTCADTPVGKAVAYSGLLGKDLPEDILKTLHEAGATNITAFAAGVKARLEWYVRSSVAQWEACN